MAARQIGMTAVPTINVGWLSEQQRRAYIIADNKLALNAGWDAEALQVELADLNGAGFNMDLLGFDVDDLAEAMGMGGDFEPGSIEDQGRLDQKKPVTCPNCGHEF
jgi:ParB-like chromosome segregation protein Spo0J